MIRHIRWGILVAALIVSTAVAEEKTYPIHLDQRTAAGDKNSFESVAAVVQTSRWKWTGYAPTSQEKKSGYHMIMNEETVAATDGIASEAKYKVRQFKTISDEGETDLIPTGQTIVAKLRGKNTQFTVNDERPSKAVKVWLDYLFKLQPAEKNVSYDDMFGSKDAKKIGDSWPINAEATARWYSNYGSKLSAEHVKGQATLAGIERCNDQDCLKVEVDLDIDSYVPSFATTMPSDTKLEDASMKAHSIWLISNDDEHKLQRRTMSTSWRYTTTGSQEGKSFRMTVTYKEETDGRLLVSD